MPVPLTLPLSAWQLAQLGPTPQPIPIRADCIDYRTGEFASLTRDLSPGDGAMIQTFRTRRDSGAAARTHGHRFDRVRHVQPQSAVELETEARRAAEHLVRQGVVELERVVVELGEDWAEPRVEYRDLSTSRPGVFPPGGP